MWRLPCPISKLIWKNHWSINNLLDAPKAHTFFKTLTESAQKHYIDWIYEAKRFETKVNRISKAIERLEKGLKMYDVDESE